MTGVTGGSTGYLVRSAVKRHIMSACRMGRMTVKVSCMTR
jgi:hypothetical protein